MEKRTGYLKLVCERKDEKTILRESYSEGAFKITRPVYLTRSGEAYLYVMNPGGGYLEGDSYKMEIHLEKGAEAVVTTQSSTKIYKTRDLPAFQEMEIFLKKGSILEYLPDPIIAYQKARFKQRTVIRMEHGASLIFADILTPGWAPDGTLFRYDLLQSKLEIYQEDQLIVFDHIKIEPDQDITGIGYMEGYTHFGTMLVIDYRVDRLFLEELHEIFHSLSGLRFGLSKLSVPGFALRVLGNTTQEVEKLMNLCHESIRGKLFEKEQVFLRKY
ncbi:urease accessory protein UreD [Neobacillus ginsengisoli]|uniref:Urease accessory protein UreD n=1 Tax=Neobacillus ginsengisoli TaxID=904295 RepID=A0ABT9XY85_9BACI|nr:urease accessory protein UreD [Neobacillus ginsengisoli]MDQ0200511.1 urease accessory protein [Neobacillus ginsengisoli]